MPASPYKTRLIIASILSLYGIFYCATYTDWHFIDGVSLTIHEAGHVVFMFFGEFMHILGGSLFQIIVPIVFALYFYKQQEYFSASLVLFWVGQNIINVSVYISDAIVMELPLLGGDNVGHDWNMLLQMTHTLPYTHTLGLLAYTIGVCTIACAIYFSFIYTKQTDIEKSVAI